MRRLLTGHAVTFNRRHRRHGHLFQNRYKSILCQEEVYLKELVRYIHLNPLRAGIVDDLKHLGTYGFCGHSVLMGRVKRSWQEVNEVLGMFATKRRLAKKLYRSFVEKGNPQGRRKDLTGVKPSRIFSPGKDRSRVRARSLLCFWAARELGITLAELSRRTRISLSSISTSVHRGEQIVEKEGYSLLNEIKL